MDNLLLFQYIEQAPNILDNIVSMNNLVSMNNSVIELPNG